MKRRKQSMVYASRQDAGRKLGLRLRDLAVEVDLVAGLPRGGLVVAAAVADLLHRPLGVIAVRKIGHPRHREFAVGAIAEEDVVILDDEATLAAPLACTELNDVIAEEKLNLLEYASKFPALPAQQWLGCRVLIVDDGLATGATAEAAVFAARKKSARQIIMAAPVSSASAWERLNRVADEVVSCFTDPAFFAVGQYYKNFSPVTDAEVLALLHRPPPHYAPVQKRCP